MSGPRPNKMDIGPNLIIELVRNFSYLGIFTYISSVGYILPIPEEVVLSIFGFLAAQGHLKIYLVIPCVLVAGLTGENILYWLTRGGSLYVDRLKKPIKKEIWEKYEKVMAENIFKALILVRFLVGFRFIGPILAASARVGWKRFMIAEGIILSVYVSLFTLFGYFLHERLHILLFHVESLRQTLAVIISVALLVYILKRLRKKKKQPAN